jgi:G3E family GTPase
MMTGTLMQAAIITGFLGAGKTSLLNSLIKDPLLANACFIINEFGDVGLDHLLVEASDEAIVEMSSGCLCCTIRGDLIDTIDTLLARRAAGEIKAFDRIVIETTGLADPAPIIHAFMQAPQLINRVQLMGVITVVDGVNGEATFDQHVEAVKQVAVADRVVLTKLDLLSGKEGEDALFSIIERVHRLAPAARLLTTHRGEATAARLFNMGLYNPASKSVDVAAWLGDEAVKRHERHHHTHDVSRHGDSIKAYSFTEPRAISPSGLELFIALLTSYHGPKLLRFKGLIHVDDDPTRPVAVHGVQHVFHPPARLEQWPDGQRLTRIVVIVDGIAKADIENLFRAFTDQLTGAGAAHSDKTLAL